jgi:hypothetical protein
VIEKLQTTAKHTPEKAPLTDTAFRDATVKEFAT